MFQPRGDIVDDLRTLTDALTRRARHYASFELAVDKTTAMYVDACGIRQLGMWGRPEYIPHLARRVPGHYQKNVRSLADELYKHQQELVNVLVQNPKVRVTDRVCDELDTFVRTEAAELDRYRMQRDKEGATTPSEIEVLHRRSHQQAKELVAGLRIKAIPTTAAKRELQIMLETQKYHRSLSPSDMAIVREVLNDNSAHTAVLTDEFKIRDEIARRLRGRQTGKKYIVWEKSHYMPAEIRPEE